MKGRGDRSARVAEMIREEVSLILQNRVKDPGMRLVTVTEVSLTPDLKSARIHYSVLGGDEERLSVRDALRRSKGFIRSELGKALRMRFCPEVAFLFDNSFDRGARIDRLLKDISEHEPGQE